ncbi:MAG: TIGR02757 family protein [Nitrospiria bacterium]
MHLTHDKRLHSLLETLHRQPIPQDWILSDPIALPRRYRSPLDIEVVGLLSAMMAYGRVHLFKAVVEKILALCGVSPYEYVANFDPVKERSRFQGIYYRFNRAEDFLSLLQSFGRVLRQYGSLGTLFAALYREDEADIGPTLSRFVAVLSENCPRPLTRGLAYLLPSPTTGSACKRFNLFLRWMIRPKDGVDFGLWSAIPAAKLIMPLDTHIVRISGYLGLTSRKSPDWKMATEITMSLKKFDPIDPLKFDFPLCHLGISGACPEKEDREKCSPCLLKYVCLRGMRWDTRPPPFVV